MQDDRSELGKIIYSFRQALGQLGVFSAIINILMLSPSIYMMQIYDRVIGSRNEFTLLMLTILIFGIYALMSGLKYVRSLTLIRLGNKLDMQMNNRTFVAAFHRNLSRAGGSPAQAMGDLTSVRQFMTGQGVFAIFDAPWLPIYIVFCFLFHWMLGVIVTIGAVILLILAFLTDRLTRKPLTQANNASVGAAVYANNNLRNAEVIEAMGMLPAIQRKWFSHYINVLKFQTVASDRSAAITSITEFVRMCLQSLALGTGAFLVLHHQITPGMMIAGSILMGRALQPVEIIISTWRSFVGVKSSWARLESLFKNYPERPENSLVLPKPEGRIVFENVYVTPPGGNAPILKGVDFAISKGDVVGIIGPSASGKSTMARLMVGVWPTQAGKVRLDGADVFLWDKEGLGPYIGYLPQDIELFEGTIAENIARFGVLNSEKVITAAKMAGVHEMILRFPQGYDTRLGADGGMLSGGQKQRIALARTLYDDPSVLVWDEPNSNLDEVGEVALVKVIEDLKKKGKTVVLITHRTSILSSVDKLLLIKDGVLQAYGPRDSVLEAIRQQQIAIQQKILAQMEKAKQSGSAPQPAA